MANKAKFFWFLFAVDNLRVSFVMWIFLIEVALGRILQWRIQLKIVVGLCDLKKTVKRKRHVLVVYPWSVEVVTHLVVLRLVLK